MTEKTLEEKRDAEHEFYRDLYKHHGYDKKSRRHKVTDQVCMKWGNRSGLKSWLDVGAGAHIIKHPHSIDKFRRTDPGNDKVAYSFAIHELEKGFGKESFDVVSSFDVLEHLFPEELDEGIMCLWNVTRPGGRLIISVGTDVGGPWNNRHVHLTVQPMEWWKKKLESLYGVEAKHVATSKRTSPFFVVDKPK